jgi:hypothetical protein
MAKTKRLNPDSGKTKYKSAPIKRGPGKMVKATKGKNFEFGGIDFGGPISLAGIAGLVRAASKGGFFTRLNNSGIPEMYSRSADAQRRLAARDFGRESAKYRAVGERTMKGFQTEQSGKDYRFRSSGTFPQGGPSGKSLTPFSSPGSLLKANDAGKSAIRSGIPRTTPPGGTRSVEGGARIRGFSVRGGQGGGGGGIGKDKNKIR